MTDFLPFAQPSIGDEEIADVVDCLKNGWLTTGKRAARFEADFADFLGVDHALAVNSATAGLHLALEAIGVGRGDKVLTSVNTFTATTEVIRYLGADPVLVDIDPDTLNLSVDGIRSCLEKTENCKAIIPVHFAGQLCEMNEILDMAKRHDVRVIEDAAHAIPASYKGQMVGTMSDLSVFSFYATKPIATGEGGMVVTNNPAYAQRIKTMRLHGINRDVFDRYTSSKPAWHYDVVAPGYKYNLSDIAAAMGIHQLAKAHMFHEKRQAIAEKYNEALADLPVVLPRVKRPLDIHSWHLYVIQLELERLGINRDVFIEQMAREGVGTSVHFIPIHLHSYWRDRYGYRPDDFPNAHAVYERCVSLPIYPKMTNDDVSRVIGAVESILKANLR